MIELAGQRRDLATMPLGEVSKLASAVAAEIGYSPGTARRELVRHVRELQAAPRETRPEEDGAMKGKLTTGRPGSEPGKSGTAVAMLIAAAIAVLLAVRWLARLDGLQLAGVAAAVAMVLFGWWAVRPRRRLPRHRVRHMRLRLRLRLHPGPGHATLFELWLRWGRGAAARRARRARPSLSCWTRRLRPSQTSVLIGRAQYHRRAAGADRGARHLHRPAAQGQVGGAGGDHRVLPGAGGGHHDPRGPARADRAGPGPRAARCTCGTRSGWRGVASTMRWDLLGGCEDPATAIRRAVPLSAVASYKGEGEDFWAAAIELWLQTLLHVAALRRGSMDLVHYWALSRTPDSFLAAVGGAGGEAERWGTLIRDLMTSAATKTTDTIRYMIAANLAFMLDPVLREAVTPEAGQGMFSPAGVRPRRRHAVPDRRVPRRAARRRSRACSPPWSPRSTTRRRWRRPGCRAGGWTRRCCGRWMR